MPYTQNRERRTFDAFGRIGLDDPKPDNKIRNFRNPTKLSAAVGGTGRNSRRDVAKVEKLLGDAGTLDLKQTDGPTGYWGMRTDEATRQFQKKHGLKTDAEIKPNGPTLQKLRDVRDAAKQRKERRGDRPTPKKSKIDWSASDKADTLERMAREKIENDAKKEYMRKLAREEAREKAIKDASKPRKPSRPARGGGAPMGGFKQPGYQPWDYDPYKFLE